jgi:hypothetical protein
MVNMHPIFNGISAAYANLAAGNVYVEKDSRWYSNNSNGHRGKDFTENTDTLIVGCSVTYGVGLELEETWGHIVSEAMGFDYRMLAFPGVSISKMVREIVEYVTTFGPPKRILALMPDSRRVDLFEAHKEGLGVVLINANPLRVKLNTLDDISYVDAKSGKIVGHVDYPSAVSMASLNYLEKFCALLDIKLCWTTWQENRSISETYKEFPSYFNMRLEGEEVEKSFPDCTAHVETGSNFKMASDKEHWGHHYHLHAADRFLEQLFLLETS